MSVNPLDCRYTKEHEWARRQGTLIVIGVTSHAQQSLGDVVYVELPKVGDTLTVGEPFGVIESTKAVSDLFAPISGKVVRVNDELVSDPESINMDPYGDGWICEVEPSDPKQWDELMDASAYDVLLKNVEA